MLLLQDYNTRIVLLGTLLLGVAAGLVGAFMLLRKRALVGDVVSHASLPGIAIAFLVMEWIQSGSGKWLPGLLLGGGLAGLTGVLAALGIRRFSRIREDAALAIILSLFFGLGISLFSVIQQMKKGNVAGLNDFIYGKASSMLASDVVLLGLMAVNVIIVCLAFTKEMLLICFDEEFAAAQGWPVSALDVQLMVLVVTVTVIGLQSVGLLLVVAMLITPAAAARFWTDQFGRMLWLSAFLGGLSAALGVMISALFPRLAAGAIIVLMGGVVFAISLIVGTRRGVWHRWRAQRESTRRVGRHDLLRALYECATAPGATGDLNERSVFFAELVARRSWSQSRVKRLLKIAEREGLIAPAAPGTWRLTKGGAIEAQRVARNHRLWELYLITHADIAPSHVDRDADEIEHKLDPEVIQELETLLLHQVQDVPPSPHA